jgi:hypothetical protein
MSHYKHAPGQPPCKAGAACHFKNPVHWQSFDHPAAHPKLMRRAMFNHGPSKTGGLSGGPIDRSGCSLEGKVGDDPKTAKYTCAGCGTCVVGFGRWRNHMKRAKVSRGERNDPRKRSSNGSAAPPAVLQRYGVVGDAAPAPARSDDDDDEEEEEEEEEEDDDEEEEAVSGEEQEKEEKEGESDGEEESEEEESEEDEDEEQKSESDDDDDEEEESEDASEEEKPEPDPAPKKRMAPVAEPPKKQVGTRYIGEVGKSGKRQRKFF